MNGERARTTVRWTSGINALAGVWLIAAPFVLGYAELFEPFWNDVTVGVVIALLALVRVGAPLRYRGLSWINAVLGAWLIAAPFVLGYGTASEEEIAEGAAATASGAVTAVGAEAAYWNDIIVGIIALVLAIWSAAATPRRAAAPVAPPREVAPVEPPRQTTPRRGE